MGQGLCRFSSPNVCCCKSTKFFEGFQHSVADVTRAGFRQTVIYPFNPQAFDYTRLAPSEPSTPGTTSFTALPVSPTPGTTSVTALPVHPVSPGPSSPMFIPSMEQPFHSLQGADAVMPADPWPPTENLPLPWVSAAITPARSLSERLVSMEYQLGREQRQRFLRRLENGFDVGSD